uniref:hypothetical protein n=1 Tax=Trichocoleus desertorum TaxID=1481672 RepID=UPI0025B32F10|nr:hypothetical protein [Trichocoleus desertorum]
MISALYQSLYLKQPLDTALLVQAIRGIIPLSVSRREELLQRRAIAKERFISVK